MIRFCPRTSTPRSPPSVVWAGGAPVVAAPNKFRLD
jgi:hypothetical protein